MTAALKPCPFCGGPAVNVADRFITCGAAWNQNCIGHRIRAQPDEWNTRSGAAAVGEERGFSQCPDGDYAAFVRVRDGKITAVEREYGRPALGEG